MLDIARNNLDRETSPYLLQHRDNPVHWQPWGPEALAAAQRLNRPILLSVGYAACHWCHVMAHESFEDAATAAVMNELYINIKVDREERPDIDTIYMSALHMLGEQGGWPLTMFLTPDGAPFWGGTYFPPTSRYGRPGFRDVLRRIADAYREDKEGIEKNTKLLTEGLARLSTPDDNVANDRVVTLSPRILDQVAEPMLGNVDMQRGGLQGAPKFPQTGIFELIWRSYLRKGSPQCRHAVEVTLDQMCQGGIYDHLGGGFARYSTDPDWHVPHFEKMLYDNAELLDLMCLVWSRTRSPLYEARMRETINWVLQEMLSPGGGFAATLDADSEGVEGKFYTWTAGEVVDLLGSDALAFMPAYDVTEHGNWEETNILRRTLRPELGDRDFEARLQRCRDILLTARAKRIRPGWDDKVLADWNGLMIGALAHCGMVLHEPSWIDAAENAFRFVQRNMSEAGRLKHSWRHTKEGGKLKHTGLLDDYANMSRAALILFEITGFDTYLDQARDWVAVVDAHYWDDANQGYFLTADDAEALITRTRTVHDNATPSGNGIMLQVLAKLWYLTGDAAYRERADGLLSAFAGEIGRAPLAVPSLLIGFDLLTSAVQIVIIGNRNEAMTDALIRASFGTAVPNRVLMVVAPGSRLPDHHPASGKTAHAGAAFVCRGNTCSLPITDPAALRDALNPTGA